MERRSVAVIAFAAVAIVACGATLPGRLPIASATGRSETVAPVALTVEITVSTYGNLQATTSPGATCTASSVLPSGRHGTSKGLQTTQAGDAAGRVGWTYQLGTNTKAGTGTHTVTCTVNRQSAVATAPFTVP